MSFVVKQKTTAVTTLQNDLAVDTDPVVTSIAGGGWVVAWTQNDKVKFKIFDQNGVGSASQSVDGASGVIEKHPTIARMSDGGFIIGWISNRFAPDDEVYVRRYDKDGTLLSNFSQPKQVTFDSVDDILPSLTGLPNGEFALSWLSPNGADLTVVEQRFTPDAAPIGMPTP